MKKFYLLMMFALLGMVANAAEKVTTSTFEQGFRGDAPAGQIISSDVLTWTVDKAIYVGWDTNKETKKGAQLGKSKQAAGEFTLQTAENFKNVKKVEVYLSVANDGSASVSTFVGETQMGIATDFNNTTPKVYTFEGAPVSGNISFALNGIAKALYVQKVVIYEEENVDPNQVVAPTFSLTSGTYFKTQELSVSCETEGAKVFYTIDNGEGVSEDREYLEPIQLTNGIYEINAWATKDGFKTSSTVSAIYEIKVIPFEEINVENVKEGKYIIAYNDVETGKSYIMKNEVISDYYVGAEEFDLTTNTPAETDLFVVKQTEGGYTIQNSGNTYVALIQSGKFTNLKPQETEPFVWNFAKSENGNIVATGQGIDSYMSFKMYNTTPEFLAEKNGNYPMFYFVSGTSSVNDAVANEFKAVAVVNGIEVNVAEAGLVSVYNAAGQLVANVNVAEGATTINVAGGFYIVKAGNNVAKVLVK